MKKRMFIRYIKYNTECLIQIFIFHITVYMIHNRPFHFSFFFAPVSGQLEASVKGKKLPRPNYSSYSILSFPVFNRINSNLVRILQIGFYKCYNYY